jgi:SAM-dependent methyltransferase
MPGNIQFKTMDIVRASPGEAVFDALLDRGCFHNIPKALAAYYVRNVADSAKPGAHFIFLDPAPSHNRAERLPFLEATFRPRFAIERVEDSFIFGDSSNRRPMPALALWMTRV